MAQLLPDKDKQRPLAFMVLAVALIMAYWLGFHWFFERHAALNEEIESQRQREAGYRGMVAERPLLDAALKEVRAVELENDYFLSPNSTALASAELTSLLKTLIALHADSSEQCQVVSNQNVRIQEKERFQRVTNNMRLRCELEDLHKVLFHLENGTPYVFVDNLSIYRQVTRRPRGGRQIQRQQTLDVRFHLSGYIRAEGDV